MTWLDFDFMRRAFLAALVVGLVAPSIGVFLVQRRLALLGDGMGHVALTGVGLAFLTGTSPIGTALVVAVLGGPAFLLYAAAWFLLPDTLDDTHLERLMRGTWSAATIARVARIAPMRGFGPSSP